MADINIERIGKLFPNCLTERIVGKGKDGKDIIGKGIDFEKLKQELSKSIVDGAQERYQFTWPGKREAIRIANTPTNMTLRPDMESSVDFDNTGNLYIEGDNLEVLKLLREDYLGKVKMIYIDPPYNTGNDFVYEDDFSQTAGEFKDKSGMFDEDGNMVLQNYEVNSESNGRFHTDWLNMIYPRLTVAKDLLTEDGVIFISIDDNEVENLRKVCDEVFGERNHIASIIWQRRTSPDMRKLVSTAHDYILLYSKDINLLDSAINKVQLSQKDAANYSNPDNDPRGPWASSDFTAQGFRPNQMYEIITPGGAKYLPPEGKCWKNVESEFLKQCEDGRFWFGKDGKGVPRRKTFLFEKEGKNIWTWWPNTEVGHTQEATQEVKKIFEGHTFFDYPKPLRLLSKIVQIGTKKDSIILDFFSGSATTAHAVMQLNAEDGGNRKYIMVQLPELTDEKSEACKSGYSTICEIGKERIRRAGKKILEEQTAKETESGLFDNETKRPRLDVGFRVLKLDTSNMQDVYYTPEESSAATLFDDNVKPDRTPEDLLFQVMLECNLPLSAKIERKTIAGKEVFSVNNDYLIACFDDDVNETVITEVAKRKPYYFIMRDSSLSSDQVADNFEQIFNAYSKDTLRRII
mgnify:FL=1